MSNVDLYSNEALLDDRERICLAGYLLMKDTDDRAMVKAYVYSRSYKIQDEDMDSLMKKVKKWSESAKVQAFLQMWSEQGKIMNDQARAKMQQQPQTQQKTEEELSATEEIIQRFEQLYRDAEDVDDKAKILKMIVDARHKNKDEVKEDTRTTRIYLPQRCSECVLYKKEQTKIV